MPRQTHHIIYDPEWTVELANGFQHKVITLLQRSKSTPENYAALTNFLHAIVHEWNRMRKDLDVVNE